ncbi:hypothetical protein AAF712_009713 [Marasmius tenuissimus]|uniref:F-box domain-containing protein n=1 Tax=Marasmius tenuissimus TaxID=585030 RepID=A0ABR2ZQX5_9AGAR
MFPVAQTYLDRTLCLFNMPCYSATKRQRPSIQSKAAEVENQAEDQQLTVNNEVLCIPASIQTPTEILEEILYTAIVSSNTSHDARNILLASKVWSQVGLTRYFGSSRIRNAMYCNISVRNPRSLHLLLLKLESDPENLLPLIYSFTAIIEDGWVSEPLQRAQDATIRSYADLYTSHDDVPGSALASILILLSKSPAKVESLVLNAALTHLEAPVEFVTIQCDWPALIMLRVWYTVSRETNVLLESPDFSHLSSLQRMHVMYDGFEKWDLTPSIRNMRLPPSIQAVALDLSCGRKVLISWSTLESFILNPKVVFVISDPELVNAMGVVVEYGDWSQELYDATVDVTFVAPLSMGSFWESLEEKVDARLLYAKACSHNSPDHPLLVEKV